MTKGYWLWPSDARSQRKMLRKVAASPHLVAAMGAIAKGKDGMSNAELDDAISDSSEWMTLWVIRQLTSLGFIDFKVDFFGNPNKYQLTDLGRNALAVITGKPLPPKPAVPPATAPAPAPQPAAPKAS